MRVLRFPYVSHMSGTRFTYAALMSEENLRSHFRKHDLRVLADTNGTQTTHKRNTGNIYEPNIRETEMDL